VATLGAGANAVNAAAASEETAMQPRILVLEQDDPEEPGLLMRRYVKVAVCWDPSLGGWGWFPMTAAGAPAQPLRGPFDGSEAAQDAAQDALGGEWEDERRA
jgi:hypothetical protein